MRLIDDKLRSFVQESPLLRLVLMGKWEIRLLIVTALSQMQNW